MNLPRGHSRWPEYSIWHAIIARCTNPKHRAFPYYGGRGICFDNRWNIFSNFISDVGRRPTKNHTIEREDNENGYFPWNVTWATRKQQQANTRKTRYVVVNGFRVPFCTAYQAMGMKKETALARIRLGWTPQQAIDRPFRAKKSISPALRARIRRARGSQYAIAARFGVSQSSVSSIKRGEWA